MSAGDAVLSARLKLIGSCRNAGDEARVEALRQQAEELQLQDHVDFHVNAPWDEASGKFHVNAHWERGKMQLS